MTLPQSLLDIMPVWAPPEHLSCADWCEKHLVLSREYSASTGLIRLDSWQREMFNAISEPSITQITVVSATQLVKTLLMQASIAFKIATDPGPMLFAGYKDLDAEKFSKERITPMIRDIPALNARVSPSKSRDSSNTVGHKVFPGGSIDFVGSLSPDNFARRTIRDGYGDEVDKWPRSSGDEGDGLSLMKRRLARFGSRGKLIIACSPTIEGESRIWEEYELSDMRKPYVGCHHCGHMQLLRWTNVLFDKSLHPSDAGETARYKCEKCEGLWTDLERANNVRESCEWRAHGPFHGHAGFWISHLYSFIALHSMAALTKEWLEARGNTEKQKVFINTNLAELWRTEGERPAWEVIKSRAETYEIGREAKLPQDAVLLFSGVDVQAKRLEIQTLAFGPDIEGNLHIWVVDYTVIELFEDGGNGIMTSSPKYWVALRNYLLRPFLHPSGAEVPIACMSIDVGHNPEPVYQFAKAFPQPVYSQMGLQIGAMRTVLCVRGRDSDNINAISHVTERETARQRQGPGQDLHILTLGTGFLKMELYSELLGRMDLHRIHLSATLTDEYFRGLVAEKRITSGKEIKWERLYPRNEPLDSWVYARGGFYAMKGEHLGPAQWAAARRRFGIPPLPGEPAPVQRPASPKVIPPKNF